jgi:hypothetical protein
MVALVCVINNISGSVPSSLRNDISKSVKSLYKALTDLKFKKEDYE